jgi:polyribonucleotide nucleotidyltransferase
MFPKGMVNDVVLTISPIQIDRKHSPGELSIIGSSLATLLAGIPFAGPVGAIRIGHINGEFVMNMTDDQAADSIIDLHVAGTKTEINMLEA